MTDDQWLAWAAGMFEGEGCVFIERKRPWFKNGRKVNYHVYAMRIDIANSDIAILDALKQRYGGSVQALVQRDPRYRPCFHWRLGSVNAAVWLKAILPYIVGGKKRQVELALEFAEKYSGDANRIGYGGRAKSDKERQEDIYQTLRLLKHEPASSSLTA